MTPKEIAIAYLDGASISELRRNTGLSQRQITKFVLDSGGKMRRQGYRPGKPLSEAELLGRKRGGMSNKGKKKPPRTEAHKLAASVARRARKVQPATGMRHSAEAKAKMSATRKGPLNPRWIDGRKQSPYPATWTKSLRAMIRERDGQRCVDCGSTDRLQVHHNDENKQNCDPVNLLTVCYKCHGKRHRRTTFGPYIVGSCGRGSILHPFSIVLNPEMLHVADNVRVDSFVKIESGEGIVIGKNVHIASYCHLNIGGGELIMEEGTSAGSGCRIITGSNVPGPGRGCSAIDPNAVIVRSRVVIKRNAVLFAGVTVLPGVTIGEGAIVAAGAVVRCDVPPGEMWGGIPARKLRDAISVTHHPNYDSHSDRLFVEATAELYGWVDECK